MDKIIESSWYHNEPWLMVQVVLSDFEDINFIMPYRTGLECPYCEYPEAVQLGKIPIRYYMRFYCPECGLLWTEFAAKCPECGMFVEYVDEEYVECPKHGVWDIELVKEELREWINA